MGERFSTKPLLLDCLCPELCLLTLTYLGFHRLRWLVEVADEIQPGMGVRSRFAGFFLPDALCTIQRKQAMDGVYKITNHPISASHFMGGFKFYSSIVRIWA
jgi:hypothetical protein